MRGNGRISFFSFVKVVIMSFRTAGKPVFPTDHEEISWFNHQAGYIVKTTYSPSSFQYQTELTPYNLPLFMPVPSGLMLPRDEGVNVVGGNGTYNGHDNSIRAMNRSYLKN